jgi:phosphinothricin acetyltransferase
LPGEAFELFLESSRGYPTGVLRDETGTVLGFGMLRAHKAIPEFAHTAEILYFLHQDYLRIGLGRALLDKLEKEGSEQGITTILAHISSKNQASIAFHTRNGFRQCGCFQGVGKKHGQVFDVIWMQKIL